MDSSAKEKTQYGGDTMDVGAAGGWSWYGDGSGDSSEAYEGAYAVGLRGKGEGKGKRKETVIIADRRDISLGTPLSAERHKQG